MSDLYLEKSWKDLLSDELKQAYFQELLGFLQEEDQNGQNVFPPKHQIFEALNLTPFSKVKVVILGQDPYHGNGQAHGLSFSVPRGVKPPPSLVNIYKELNSDLNIPIADHGCLETWAHQGVLLLNNVLTVREGAAASHQDKGWEKFTDKIIELINDKKEHVVFILWGSPAQKKAANINQHKHFVIKSVHPSPLSSYRGFFGSKPFSKCNAYLKAQGIQEIDWTP
jgi:uracil-DNA glycosylase